MGGLEQCRWACHSSVSCSEQGAGSTSAYHPKRDRSFGQSPSDALKQAERVIDQDARRLREQRDVRAFYKQEKQLASPLSRLDHRKIERDHQRLAKTIDSRIRGERLPDRLKQSVQVQREHSRSQSRGMGH